MDDAPNQDELISRFCDLTGVAPSKARPYLEANHWDIESAVAEYFTSLDEASEQPDYPEDEHDMEPEPMDDDPVPATGGHILGTGSAAPQPQPSSSQPPPPPSSAPRKKFATLGDLGSANPDAHDDDADDDDSPNQDMFAGGEKSALAVQNPDDIKRKIIEKAKKATPLIEKEEQEAKARPSHFTGAARTLGGDDTPSQVIDDPKAKEPKKPSRVTRVLHFWNDGFSIDDGELYRSDDPRNRAILDGIRQGRAPLSIMDVEPGQEVDVNIEQHTEDYVKPKKKYTPWGGAGQRLGSPTPGDVSTTNTRAPAPSPLSTSAPPAPVEVDEGQPMITLQIRLGDGTRLVSRFNTTHTIGDVYQFVGAASPTQRAWVLMTTFPNKELSDKGAVLGDLSEFKKGGVVVQKWQ